MLFHGERRPEIDDTATELRTRMKITDCGSIANVQATLGDVSYDGAVLRQSPPHRQRPSHSASNRRHCPTASGPVAAPSIAAVWAPQRAQLRPGGSRAENRARRTRSSERSTAVGVGGGEGRAAALPR